MRLVYHADDLGITPGATASILKAWRSGALDGFSIIANGDGLHAVRTGLAEDPGRPARIAVHFNLTEGPASAPPEQIPLLVDASGRFHRGFLGHFLGARSLSEAGRAELRRQVELECRAQIHTVQELCGSRRVLAVDGHNHIHMIPEIFEAVVNAARKESIPEIRISREPFYLASPIDPLRPFWWVNVMKHVLLRSLSRRAIPAATSAGLRFPDCLIGVLYTGHMTGVRAKRGIEAAGDAAWVEVVFHVGQSTPSECARWKGRGYAAFHRSARRAAEFTELLQLRGVPEGRLTPPSAGSSTGRSP